MPTPIALSLKGVGKCYRVPGANGGPPAEFWATRDVTFDVPNGLAAGIIGHNGAGKSTLLKLLTGITAPTTGEIRVSGRMAGLLEVGSGFHPELTGRENIFLSGTILGMSRKEIHRKLESIIDFAEVRPFVDLPVKRFSSGMYVRLGFSIAAHIEPEVLLLDEVLAVGDASFQEKCLTRVLELKRSGVTILFISHDLRAVERVCDRVLVMQRGKVVHDGPAVEAISAYQALRGAAAGERRVRYDKQQLTVDAVRFLNAGGREPDFGVTGSPLRVRLEYTAQEQLDAVRFELLFIGSDTHWKTTVHNGDNRITVHPGKGAIEFLCNPLTLCPDVYQIDATVDRFGAEDPLDWLIGCQTLPVQAPYTVKGCFQQPFTWSVPPDAS